MSKSPGPPNESEFLVFDITPPTSVPPVGDIETLGLTQAVAVFGDLAVLAEPYTGLRTIDVSDPTALEFLGLANIPAEDISDIAMEGSLAVVLHGEDGVQIVDVAHPRAPRPQGSVDTPGFARSVDVDGSIAYVADAESGLQVIDVADPLVPTIVGAVDTPGSIYDVAVSGDYAYVTESPTGLYVVDVSVAAAPTIVGSAAIGSARAVAVDGASAYVCESTGMLHVIDVSSPTAPVLVGSAENVDVGVSELFVSNGYVYVNGPGVSVFDVSTPESPWLVGSTAADPIYPPIDLALSTEYAFVATFSSLTVLPLHCTIVGVGDVMHDLQGLSLAPAPNPSTGGFHVRFRTRVEGAVRAGVYDALGRRTARLVDQRMPSGSHVIEWDGRDDRGRAVSAGVYWIRVSAPDQTGTERIVVGRGRIRSRFTWSRKRRPSALPRRTGDPMKHSRIALWTAFLVAVTLVGVPIASATSMVPRNIVDLIQLSERILVGDVQTVRDGFDPNGVPYTEIGIDVDDPIKGTAVSAYTFRQYGLLAPKELTNGRIQVGVSPEGWPHFSEGERVLLFLYSAGKQTGLRTTVGLYQGKLTIERGLAQNDIQNANLFRGVEVDVDVLNVAERALLEVASGPVDAGTLVSLIRKAVDNRWIEAEVMRSAN